MLLILIKNNIIRVCSQTMKQFIFEECHHDEYEYSAYSNFLQN